ncbi:MAG: hypothetical protein H6658_12965 [Ardenticatenaceae bacterium]|nr:hypothetical protein [Ardenticatenaceae bacterium]
MAHTANMARWPTTWKCAPKDGLATVAVGKNGRIHIGQWGEEIQPDNNWLFWRQNAHLVVHNGTITPKPKPTPLLLERQHQQRSRHLAFGIRLERRCCTLTLLRWPQPQHARPRSGHVTAGVYQGMLLDINHHWVHFTTFQPEDGELTAVPLLNDMSNQPDRFLRQYQRDFFYITLAETSGQAAEKFGD